MSEAGKVYISEALDFIDPETVAEALELRPRRNRGYLIAAAAAVCAFAVGAAVWFSAVNRTPKAGTEMPSKVSEISDSNGVIAGGYEGGAETALDTGYLDNLIASAELIVVGTPGSISYAAEDGGIFSGEAPEIRCTVSVTRVLKGQASDTVVLAQDDNTIEAEPFVRLPEAGEYVWFFGAERDGGRELMTYIWTKTKDGKEDKAYSYILSRLEE